MRLSASVCALVLTLATGAAAEPQSISYRYSGYEEQAIHDAESALGTRVDALPEGKTIERIDFVRLDPIDVHDPLPHAMDEVHATSRVWVLRHEILVREGDPWRTVVVDESARNLRTLPQLSLVLCVPMLGSSPDRVRLVVITKDVWSLYVDFDVAATPGGLELLDLEPKETNVAGLQHTALGRFILQPKSYSLGASYEIPRLDGRWLDLLVDGNVIMNRDTRDPEGSYGLARITRPLYSSRTEWAWSEWITWTDRVDRQYTNAAVQTWPLSAPPRALWIWRERTLNEQGMVTRSFGWETKSDFSLGASVSHATYTVPDEASADPAARAAFQAAEVPVGEDRVGPFVQWHGYTSDFQRYVDVDTLALQEDNRLGHDLWVRVYPVLRALGSTRDLLGVYTAAAYTVPLGDGFAKAAVESTIETEATDVSDASITANLAIVTPRLGVGRLVYEATLLDRWRNHLNLKSELGGESRLRGYPSRYLAGKADMLASNLEYRSLPLHLPGVLLGVAGFYDVGDVFDSFDQLQPRHSVGVGLRAVFPEIARDELRFDVGFPVPPDGSLASVSFFLAFRQAVPVPVVGQGFAQ